jgi:DNA-directed RNA polymerase specialized sigma24 family protein
MSHLTATGKKGAAATSVGHVDLDDVGLRLLEFARARARTRGWRLGGTGGLAEGKAIEDIVQEAIVSLYDGSRTWDPSQQPDVFEYLKSVVNSKLDHLCNSAENRRVVGGGDADVREAEDTPETLLIEKQREELRRRAKDLLLDAIAQDPDLSALYDAIDELGQKKTAAIAERLQKPVSEINNLKRRLERQWNRVRAQLETELAGPQGGHRD